ncbi:DUF1161 domain-containing protein [Halomonas sp. WWR20]
MSRLVMMILISGLALPALAQTTLEKAQNEATNQEKPATVGIDKATAEREIRPCKELRAEIDAKIQASGAENYTLDIVPQARLANDVGPSEADPQGEVVGSCDSGTKRIIYRRQ